MASISDEYNEVMLDFIGDSSFPEELAILEAAEPPLAASFLALLNRLHSLKREKSEKRRFLAWAVPLAEAEFPDRRGRIWRTVREALREYDRLTINISIVRNWTNVEHLNFDFVQQCISYLMDLISKEARV